MESSSAARKPTAMELDSFESPRLLSERALPLTRDTVADSKDTDVSAPQPIYDAAQQCLRLFEECPQEPKDHIGEPISASHRRFRSWAAYLGAFALKSACLDTRLRYEPEIRDLVMLLLDVLETDLQRSASAL